MTHEQAQGWSGYSRAHLRVRQARGPARTHTCPCGRPAAQWAYDHEDPDPRTAIVPSSFSQTAVMTWSEDPERYVALCYRCHARLDLEHGNRANIAAGYRKFVAAERARRRRSQETGQQERLYIATANGLRHLGGVAWQDASVPGLSHRCWAQTKGQLGEDHYEWCACGAVRRNRRAWADRNTRTRVRWGA